MVSSRSAKGINSHQQAQGSNENARANEATHSELGNVTSVLYKNLSELSEVRGYLKDIDDTISLVKNGSLPLCFICEAAKIGFRLTRP